MTYDPNSTDAMFSRILERLDELSDSVARVESQTTKTNGRVNALERDKWYQRGIAATLAVLGAAAWQWLVGKL